jgi:hypothetical protein
LTVRLLRICKTSFPAASVATALLLAIPAIARAQDRFRAEVFEITHGWNFLTVQRASRTRVLDWRTANTAFHSLLGLRFGI